MGLQVKLLGIQGDLTAVQLHPDKQQPTVPEHILLLSAGIGVTPNVAVVRGIGAFELQGESDITMVHVERYEKDLLFQGELMRRANSYSNFKMTNIISHKEGRLTNERLEVLLPSEQHVRSKIHAFVCGPTQFMSDMSEFLVTSGVPTANVHTESFEF